MVVAGLWHGTTLSFLLFGVVHGVYLIVQRVWDAVISRWLGKPRVRRWRKSWSVQLASIFLTFTAAAFAYIFFCLDLDHVIQMFAHISMP